MNIDEFAEGSEALRAAFPFAFDATTMAGLAALRRELPFDWPDALNQARAPLAAFTAMSTLRSVLSKPTDRTVPQGSTDMGRAAGRRSSRRRLCAFVPEIPLEELNEAALADLVREYRLEASAMSSPMISADVTELRFAVDHARAEASLSPLKPPRPSARPRRRVGRAPRRSIATLEQVERLLTKAPADLRALLALRVATTAPLSHLLDLRAGDLDLARQRLVIDAPRTRGGEGAPARLLFGLPDWCVDLLRSALPGIDGWAGNRPIFPKQPGSTVPRREIAHAFRVFADGCWCSDVTLADLRRLAQAIHAQAPRAVRRATATARPGSGKAKLDRDERTVAHAQEEYAAWVQGHWRLLHQPPVRPSRVSRRAMKQIRPHEPERRMRPQVLAPRPPSLPLSCRVDAPAGRRRSGTPLGEGAGAVMDASALAPFAERGPPSSSGFGWEAVAMEESRKAAAYAGELSALRGRTISNDDAEIAALACAAAGVFSGAMVGAHISTNPELIGGAVTVGKRFVAALAEELVENAKRNGRGT
ncbi:hypothetical protein LBMAG42_57370 [Deltaproteobacteria bacterium]|nr:hypothetical protein LBMAG42_57370 [Deltaproteobacteria bacterium]